MTELTPWSASDLTDVERRLLDAARRDGIPNELSSRMAAALKAHAASAGPAAHALGGVGGTLFSKAGLWGFLSVAAFAGAASWYAQAPLQSTHAPQAASSADSARPPPSAAPVPEQQFLASASGTIASPELAPSATPARRQRTAKGPRASANLSAEIALLDRARDANMAGAPERARRVLEQYRRRFEHGELEPEAEMLEIEMLVKVGASERAQRRSHDFLNAYPQHPLADRVAQIAARLDTAAKH